VTLTIWWNEKVLRRYAQRPPAAALLRGDGGLALCRGVRAFEDISVWYFYIQRYALALDDLLSCVAQKNCNDIYILLEQPSRLSHLFEVHIILASDLRIC
jgi:hypothetical protein